MSHAETNTSATPPSADRLPHSAKARQQGVSTRTLDRWVEEGRLPPPDYVAGRKYHRADSRPSVDATKPTRSVPQRDK
jgi:hypothetical protein